MCCSSCCIHVIQLFCYTCPKPNHKSHFDSNNSALRAKLQFSKCSPSPPYFSCTSCFICMLWQAHVVWQIQQLVHKLRIRIYPFLLHIPRRTWSIIRRRFLKTVTLPALELSKRITLKRPPLSSAALVGQLWWLRCCVQLMWQPSSAGSILIALKNNKQNTCWLVAATTGHLPLATCRAAPARCQSADTLLLLLIPLRYSYFAISKGSINIFFFWY